MRFLYSIKKPVMFTGFFMRTTEPDADRSNNQIYLHRLMFFQNGIYWLPV